MYLSLRYRVGQVSKLVGVPVHRLRQWECRGLFAASKKDLLSGFRYYDLYDLLTLLVVLEWRDVFKATTPQLKGFPTEVSNLLRCLPKDQLFDYTLYMGSKRQILAAAGEVFTWRFQEMTEIVLRKYTHKVFQESELL